MTCFVEYEVVIHMPQNRYICECHAHILTSENGKVVIRKEIDSLLSTNEETDTPIKCNVYMELRRDTGCSK